MTTLTHLAFSALFAGDVKVSLLQTGLTIFGSILPDLDHPQSFIGKILHPLSHPLNLRFGHRKAIHGLPLWLTILLIGKFFAWEPVHWIVIGAISHSLIDCYNISGVALLAPFSDRAFVLFDNENWQIPSGSRQDYFCCIAFIVLFGGVQYIYDLGGARAALNVAMQSPKITVEHYLSAGNQRCYITGKFRWADGRTESIEQWLIVGSEGQNLVFWNERQLVRVMHGKFLRSSLVRTDAEWISVKLNGVGTVNQDSFFYDGKKWYYAQTGTKVLGVIKSVSNAMPEIEINSSVMPTLYNQPAGATL